MVHTITLPVIKFSVPSDTTKFHFHDGTDNLTWILLPKLNIKFMRMDNRHQSTLLLMLVHRLIKIYSCFFFFAWFLHFYAKHFPESKFFFFQFSLHSAQVYATDCINSKQCLPQSVLLCKQMLFTSRISFQYNHYQR